jgi:hypothetical protein
MLTKNQWLWCAENHKPIKTTTIFLIVISLLMYGYLFIDRFFWQRNVPVTYRPETSKMNKLNCSTDEVYEMFIPSARKTGAPSTTAPSANSEFKGLSDARFSLLEFYATSVLGSEILEKRPECLGAFIADKQNWPEPYAILIVDRNTGKTIFRIARLQDYLTR